ncbi:hypothetical protein GHU05_05455 [Fructobacillus tropaeoli]|uniref:TetR/AcrR family transcriptional regulator n=1 Tax=Fructobacillus tropaeoli TaxID=709323 RepID=UPI001455DF72|nr:TetR/AcrR family transcriptional regulator [Fructobacillus tropaeoli]NLS38372.1 hypothetical protein [Fructobacillus tropaeoli]
MVKEDQRTRITKKIFRSTLIDLLKEKRLHRINVTELCRQAELSRATFYTYYVDVFDLFENIERDVYQQLEDLLLESDSNDSRLEGIVRYVGEHDRLFLVLLSVDISNNFTKSIIELSRTFSNPDGKRTNIYNYLEDYAVSGSISVLLRWLQNGKKESPKSISQLLTTLQNYSGEEIQKIAQSD